MTKHLEAVEGVQALSRILNLALAANAGTPSGPGERLLDAEALAAKCVFHAGSCLLIAQGTMLGSPPARVLDQSSLNVLVRTTVESALVFHHVFASPQTDAKRELRYLSWLLADLLERQEFPAASPESQQTQREESEQIDAMRARLAENSALKAMTPKQQRRVLEEGYWTPGWAATARKAGLDETHATMVHRFLCSYAHSGSLSVLQFRSPKSAAQKDEFLALSLRLVNIALAVLAKAYCSMFPKAEAAVGQHTESAKIIEYWFFLGATHEQGGV
jgi:hypothetical protein